MKNKLSFYFALLLSITILFNTTAIFAQQQRPRRAKEAEPAGIAPGSRVIPAGQVLVLRMESRLDSGANRPGDRFIARINETVIDTQGNLVLPTNLAVLGHVAEVSPAQLRRRSGLISITFDQLVMPDGRELPLAGVLTSADASERRRLKVDEEGSVEGPGNSAKQTTVFIGGGAATGAIIGAIAGGAVLGAGVGAAVGVAAAVLAKGKEAIVEPGTLIGVELTEKLDLKQSGTISRPSTPSPAPAVTPSAPGPVFSNSKNPIPPVPGEQFPAQTPTPMPVIEPQILKLSFVQAERVSGGSILVVATAETPSGSWRVKTEHLITRDTLEIWVKGVPPEGRASKAPSHPTVTATVADPKAAVRRVVIHGAGGDRVIILSPKTTR